MTQSRNSQSSGARHEGYLSTGAVFSATGISKLPLAAEQSAERTAHQRTADRTAHRPRDRLADTGGEIANHLVGDRTRHLACNDLPGGHPAALDVGAEDRADDRAELSQNATASAGRAASAFIRGCRRAGDALLDHLVSGLAIDGGIVFALHRARIHDRLA